MNQEMCGLFFSEIVFWVAAAVTLFDAGLDVMVKAIHV